MSDIKEKTLRLIDGLKATCQSYGMGNDGNEYKIITQVFLYKFLNGIELGNAQNGTVDLGRFSLDNMESVTLYNGQK